MADNGMAVAQRLEFMAAELDAARQQYVKFKEDGSNNAAGKVRKHMQGVRVAAKEIRDLVQGERKVREPKKG